MHPSTKEAVQAFATMCSSVSNLAYQSKIDDERYQRERSIFEAAAIAMLTEDAEEVYETFDRIVDGANYTRGIGEDEEEWDGERERGQDDEDDSQDYVVV